MAKVKFDGHIQGLEFNQYVCFSFHGNWTIFGWVIEGQGHNENGPKSKQAIYRSGPLILQKMKEIWEVVQKLSYEQMSAAGGTAAAIYELVQKQSPRITGVT